MIRNKSGSALTVGVEIAALSSRILRYSSSSISSCILSARSLRTSTMLPVVSRMILLHIPSRSSSGKSSFLTSVRQFAKDYENLNIGRIYALLLNAGINGMHSGMTEDGMEVVFQTNHLGHFLLANLMLPFMEPNGKIFYTSSDMHDAPMGKMVWEGTEALAHPSEEGKQSRLRYSFSKLCNLYFVYELAGRLEAEGSGIRVNAFNPGMMQTNFAPVDKARAAIVKLSMPKRFGDLEKSSDAYAELVVNDELAVTSANYYDRSTTAIRSSELSYNTENAKELWEASERLCCLK